MKCNGASVGVVSASYWKLIDAELLPCNLIISPADASMDVTVFTQMEAGATFNSSHLSITSRFSGREEREDNFIMHLN